MKKSTTGFIFLLVMILLTIAGCASPQTWFSAKPYKETQFLMDTIIEITAYGPQQEQAVKAAFDEFKRIQEISDKYNADSQLSKINQMAGKAPVTVDADLVKMITDSIEVSKKTKGAFDISIGALTELWGIGHKGDFVPTQAEIEAVLPLVNYQLIQVDTTKNTVYLPREGMKLDLGGVAKDYALNKATQKLKSAGITSALVNAGGDIQVLGTKPDGTPWRVGVQDPRNTEGMIAKVSLSQMNTLQTSGDYQRFFVKNGIRYAHILDPRTGKQPSEVASVTLVYKDADVYTVGNIASSGFIVLGLEQGLEALKEFPGVEAIFVTVNGKVVVTPGLKGMVD